MTETAEDKSKRNFLNHFGKAQWATQISIFYLDEESSKKHALDDSKRLRKMLGRMFPEAPWLYRLCLLFRKSYGKDETVEDVDWNTGEIIQISTEKRHEVDDPEHIAYHTFFTTRAFTRREFEKFLALIRRECDSTVNIRRRKVTEAKRIMYATAVQRQRAHDLKGYFEDNKKIHRYSLINEAALENITKEEDENE